MVRVREHLTPQEQSDEEAQLPPRGKQVFGAQWNGPVLYLNFIKHKKVYKNSLILKYRTYAFGSNPNRHTYLLNS